MDIPEGNIPPQAMQALQQQQANGMDITSILAQLSQMSPDEVSAALAQLGINVDPATLAKAAEDWVEQAGDKAAGAQGGDQTAPTAAEGTGDDEETPPSQPSSPPSAPLQDEPSAEEAMAAADTDAAEGGGESGQAEAMAAQLRSRGGGGMPRPPMRGAGGSGAMDAMISAAMTGGASNSVPGVPMPRGSAPPQPRMRGPQMPGAGTPSPSQGMPSEMRAMIGSAYRDAAANSRRGVPTGPRGARTPGTQPRSRKKP